MLANIFADANGKGAVLPSFPAAVPFLALAGTPRDTGRFAASGEIIDPEAVQGGESDQDGRSGALDGLKSDGAAAAFSSPMLSPMILSQLPPLPPGVRWLSAGEAGERWDLKERAARDRCAAVHGPQGTAVQVKVKGGGPPRWFIRNDADPALRDIQLPGDIPVSLAGMTEAQRREWGDRLAIVAAWQAAIQAANRACVPNSERLNQEEATALFLAKLKAERGLELSVRTLKRWYRQSRSQRGAGGLIDGRWGKAAKSGDDDPFLAEVRALYMTRGGLSARYCCKLARQKAREQGWTVWSDRKVTKYLAKIPLAQRIYAREGEKAYTDKAEGYINRDWTHVRANEQWNGDHHICDVWVRVGEKINPTTGEVKYQHVRPWVTVWTDCRSRKIVGYDLYIGDPSTDRIILAFRRAVIVHGVPESVYVDCGRDYLSYALNGYTRRQHFAKKKGIEKDIIFGIFSLMDVKMHHVQPYHGQSKNIERMFGTLEGQFGRSFADAYCGRSPAHRPEDLQERLDAGKAPTFEEYAEAFKMWVDLYNSSEHTGEGMEGKSPDQVFAETLITKRTAPQDLLDILLLKHSKPVLVTQNGVRCNGFQYGQYEPALKRMLGEKVVIGFDPQAPARVVILTVDGKFVCKADSNQRLPANAKAEDMQAAMKAKRHARKAELAYKQTRVRLHESPVEIMFRMAEERRAREAQQTNLDPPPGPTIRPIRSPFEAQLPAIQKALKVPPMRAAAGAEGLDLLALANAELDLSARPAPRSSFSLLTALNDLPTEGRDGGAS
ncbi:MAG: transposase domain-containing protein [Phycisphaerae bacterium]